MKKHCLHEHFVVLYLPKRPIGFQSSLIYINMYKWNLTFFLKIYENSSPKVLPCRKVAVPLHSLSEREALKLDL